MTDKEKADCLIELHKAQMDHFKQTRDIEIKVNLAYWTLIVVAGVFLYDRNIHLTDAVSWGVYALIAMALVLGHTFAWTLADSKL